MVVLFVSTNVPTLKKASDPKADPSARVILVAPPGRRTVTVAASRFGAVQTKKRKDRSRDLDEPEKVRKEDSSVDVERGENKAG
jgi:hypothetical protein